MSIQDNSGANADFSPFSRAGKRLKKINEINQAATSVFIRDGYAQFSARKVAKELGMSLNNLQYYCGNTDNLCLQMIKARLGHFVERVSQLVQNVDAHSPFERLAAAIRENSSATLHPDTASFFFQMGAMASHDPSIRQVMVSQYQEFLEGFCQLVAEVDPLLPSDRVRTYAALIATQIEGNFFYLYQLNEHAGAGAQMIETTIAFWRTTLLPTPA